MLRGPNFDRIAPLYRWLEYASLGPMLEQVRRAHLPALGHSRRALLLGDGDGRFTAALLAANPQVEVLAVDCSEQMLRLLRRRAGHTGGRLKTLHADARELTLPAGTDLIVSHFLLDCLDQTEVTCLASRLAGELRPDGLWLLSEFRVPEGWLHWPARGYIRMLYLAFAMITGLRTRRLPDHETPLRLAGLERVALVRRLGGVLTGELWQRPAK